MLLIFTPLIYLCLSLSKILLNTWTASALIFQIWHTRITALKIQSKAALWPSQGGMAKEGAGTGRNSLISRSRRIASVGGRSLPA